MKFFKNPRERSRFLRFAMVGAFGALVDFGMLNLLHLALQLPVLTSNAFSFSAAVISNFTWNRFFTYPDSRSKPIGGQLSQFFLVNLAGLGINTLVLAGLLGLTTILFGRLGYNIAKMAATGIVMFWNFYINRYWTYNDIV
jgi:putative flippase GtrA